MKLCLKDILFFCIGNQTRLKTEYIHGLINRTSVSLSDLLYSWKFIKPCCAVHCDPLCNVALSEILAGNSFIVCCHVTSK